MSERRAAPTPPLGPRTRSGARPRSSSCCACFPAARPGPSCGARAAVRPLRRSLSRAADTRRETAQARSTGRARGVSGAGAGGPTAEQVEAAAAAQRDPLPRRARPSLRPGAVHAWSRHGRNSRGRRHRNGNLGRAPGATARGRGSAPRRGPLHGRPRARPACRSRRRPALVAGARADRPARRLGGARASRRDRCSHRRRRRCDVATVPGRRRRGASLLRGRRGRRALCRRAARRRRRPRPLHRRGRARADRGRVRAARAGPRSRGAARSPPIAASATATPMRRSRRPTSSSRLRSTSLAGAALPSSATASSPTGTAQRAR